MNKKLLLIFALSLLGLTVFNVNKTEAAVPVYPSGELAVHRFYNTKTLTHFYTPDEDEALRVQQSLPDFKYEGIKFNAFSFPADGRVAVHRFYNTKTLTHFYTSDQNEVNVIRATLPDFNYEGISYYADAVANTANGGTAVYRFYNTRTLTHLYTADLNEANIIRATAPDFNYEGLKYGAATSRYFANCTDAKMAGVAPLFRGQVGYGNHLDRDSDGIACETGTLTTAPVVPSVSISTDGCTVTASGAPGLNFEYGGHDGTGTSGASKTVILPPSGTFSASTGGVQGMTSFGLIYDNGDEVVAFEDAIIQAESCPEL